MKDTPVQITEVDLGGGIDSPSGLLRIVKLARFLRRQRFQILHAHDLWSNIVGMAAAMLALGGDLEIIQDGTTGLLVPPQDSQALAAALNKVLSDEDLADRIAQAGHDYVKRNFSFERLVADMDYPPLRQTFASWEVELGRISPKNKGRQRRPGR